MRASPRPLRSANLWTALGPADLPVDSVAPHQACDLLAKMPVEDRPPWHERELARLGNYGETPTGEIDSTGDATLLHAADIAWMLTSASPSPSANSGMAGLHAAG